MYYFFSNMYASFMSVIAEHRWIIDALDIILVAYIIFKILQFFSGTRVTRILRGLMIVLVVGAVATFVQMRSMTWLIEKLLIAAAVAVPIIFQPELRRLLEALGRGELLSHNKDSSGDNIDALVKEIARAFEYFMSHKIGALVVFQRKGKLDNSIQGFQQPTETTRAALTYGILVSIFWPGSPLHDGGIIVSGREIINADCRFPLSENPDLSRWYGTRHRAAVGLTEHSDAFVVVVSEETGKASGCVGGRIQQLTIPQVTMFLENYFKNYKKEDDGVDLNFDFLMEKEETASERKEQPKE